ncbi:penicillin-binding protein [candidate division WWE3 bacterium CG08_land_8_20_14_0_20_40_13]|uniref:Penicillin-binding protein n=1 Tax=candidate division WWE3 bacterium CG08_land_8_20_14_0_20_40_13 TaxID=1975084 RepID=A0A2H0XE43_UNCKA|nr:MAG: penicillin-binding protein [candidate division WWE3 bacterium CG08_land_8_20_14_0_20_40_13]
MIKDFTFLNFLKPKLMGNKKQKGFLPKVLPVVTALTTLLLVGSVAVLFLFTYLSRDLPSPTQLTERPMEISTKIYDRNGELLYDVYANKNRTLITLDQVSSYLIDATIATEDADFYIHHGFDVLGYVRAIRNIILRQGLQGASTLTQQLAKNALLTSERTIKRKIKELVLTLQIERRYSKDQILTMYFNEAPYGSTAWGVEAASQLFFGKKAKDLTLPESALIAGLPQSPTNYSPITNPDAAKKRQQYVLKLMHEKGWVDKSGTRKYLSNEDYDKALSEELKFSSGLSLLKAPHFVMYVRQRLMDTFGVNLVESGGLKVKTTLDYKIQEKAQKILTDEVAKEAYLKVGNASLVVLNSKTGEILSMVGSKDFFNSTDDGQVNVSTSPRQPGSSIKPITYATALKMGYTASYPLLDVQTNFKSGDEEKDYIPKNYDGKFRGPIQMRYALAQSVNIPAVKMLKLVGISNMVKTANDMGISTLTYDPKYYGLALTLGGGEVKLLELTGAYTVFANEGTYNYPYGIESVEDQKGNILFSHKSHPELALDKGTAFIISNILADSDARAPIFGYGSYLNIPKHTVAVKTGTTDDKKDNWAVGFTPTYSLGVWAGNNDGAPMDPTLASGVTGAAPIWNLVMKELLQDKEDEKFVQPDNVIKWTTGKLTGYKPYEKIEEERVEYYIKGTEPLAYSPWVEIIEICKEDNLFPNDDCKKDDNTKDKVFAHLLGEFPEWQEAVDSWVDEVYDRDSSEESMYFPPTEKTDYSSN